MRHSAHNGSASVLSSDFDARNLVVTCRFIFCAPNHWMINMIANFPAKKFEVCYNDCKTSVIDKISGISFLSAGRTLRMGARSVGIEYFVQVLLNTNGAKRVATFEHLRIFKVFLR